MPDSRNKPIKRYKHGPGRPFDRPPSAAVSMSKKINMGNYESADFFVSVNGITAGMTPAQIAALLDTAKIGWDQVRRSLAEQVQAARARIPS